MAKVSFTQNIQRHVECPPREIAGDTVREILAGYFRENPRAEGYVLDEQGALRKHMMVFVDGRQISDRTALSDAVGPNADVAVMQALSGG